LDLVTRIQDLFQRLGSYPIHFVLIEMVLIWLIVYLVLKFVRNTRAAGALKGILVIVLVVALVAWVLGGGATLPRLGLLVDRFLAIFAVALVVIFQPELRRAAIRVGEAAFFRSSPSEIQHVVESITEASRYFSRSRFGAIIVIERRVGLEGLVEGGTRLGAEVSTRLLQTIFFPGTALHDLAVVIKGRVVHAAGVQLPMADPLDMTDPAFGARHRAALGLAKECDALVVVVSEETGQIRIAERAAISTALDPDELRAELLKRLQKEPPASSGETAEEESQREQPEEKS